MGTPIEAYFQTYLGLAELRKQSAKNLAKLSRLETQIEAELSVEKPDFVEVECKMREFEMTQHDQQKYVQPKLLEAASKGWMTRMDNQQLQ